MINRDSWGHSYLTVRGSGGCRCDQPGSTGTPDSACCSAIPPMMHDGIWAHVKTSSHSREIRPCGVKRQGKGSRCSVPTSSVETLVGRRRCPRQGGGAGTEVCARTSVNNIFFPKYFLLRGGLLLRGDIIYTHAYTPPSLDGNIYDDNNNNYNYNYNYIYIYIYIYIHTYIHRVRSGSTEFCRARRPPCARGLRLKVIINNDDDNDNPHS